MDTNTAIAIISLITTVIVTLIAFALNKTIKNAKYNAKESIAVLDGMREYFETNIYGLNNRLVQNEERWKDMHHLLLQNRQNANSFATSNQVVYSEFLKANGITPNDVLIDSKLVFVLTPLHSDFYEDYQVIRDIFTSRGYKCLRGDETYLKGDIFPEMLKLIVKARLVIANINGRNSNVMYELGIAQAIDKPVMLISKSPDGLPFDLKSKRFLIYETYSELEKMFDKEFFNAAGNIELP